MKKLLLVLAMILTVLGMSACQIHEEPTDPIVEFETYDYYLLIVVSRVSRQNLSQGNYLYVLHEAGKPETTDTFTYESEELWSVGEFIIAIELDEEGSVYFTDLNTTIDMLAEYWKIKEDEDA